MGLINVFFNLAKIVNPIIQIKIEGNNITQMPTLSVFLALKAIMKINKKLEEINKGVAEKIGDKLHVKKGEEKLEEIKEPETKFCPYCLTEVKYRAKRCPHCTSELDEVK